jgi:Tfp pilus assembly PilM family ATPase
VGVDIGSTSLKLAEVVGNYEKYTLKSLPRYPWSGAS